jgi:hypothetical protein
MYSRQTREGFPHWIVHLWIQVNREEKVGFRQKMIQLTHRPADFSQIPPVVLTPMHCDQNES